MPINLPRHTFLKSFNIETVEEKCAGTTISIKPDSQIEIIKPEMAVLVIWLHMVANTEPTNGKPKQNALYIVS